MDTTLFVKPFDSICNHQKTIQVNKTKIEGKKLSPYTTVEKFFSKYNPF